MKNWNNKKFYYRKFKYIKQFMSKMKITIWIRIQLKMIMNYFDNKVKLFIKIFN